MISPVYTFSLKFKLSLKFFSEKFSLKIFELEFCSNFNGAN